MFTSCLLYCPVCRQEMNWHAGYGREIRCCSKACHEEAEWRRTLSIMGEKYRPQLAEALTIPTQEDDHGTHG
jgi:hypothetical protein